MDYAKMLFALHAQQEVLRQIEEVMPKNFSISEREQFKKDNYSGYLADLIQETADTAKEIELIERDM